MVKEAGMYYMEINQVYHSNRSLKLNTTSSNNFAHGFAGDLQHVEVFYFHSGHLGSSNYMSNYDGDISQHAEYLPFGELLTDEHLNSHNTRYKYNGKEFDQETGNYYYGARYYKPKTSLWLSVDPLAEKFPGWSPYNFVMNNPINFIDPDGRAPEWVPDSEGNLIAEKGDNAQTLADFQGISYSEAEKQLQDQGYIDNNGKPALRSL
jgi:RHS repeat-associated protein